MNDSPEWSTNEVEKRYDQSDLDGVKSLLSIDDPDSEGQYFSNLSRYTEEEPYEFLGDCQRWAYYTVWNATNRTHADALPLIKEDMLFVELEMKRHQKANQRDRVSWVGLKYWTFTGVMLVALFIGMVAGLVGAENILLTGALFGLFTAITGGYYWCRMHYRIRRRQKLGIGLNSAVDIYNGRPEYWESDDRV